MFPNFQLYDWAAQIHKILVKFRGVILNLFLQLLYFNLG